MSHNAFIIKTQLTSDLRSKEAFSSRISNHYVVNPYSQELVEKTSYEGRFWSFILSSETHLLSIERIVDNCLRLLRTSDDLTEEERVCLKWLFKEFNQKEKVILEQINAITTPIFFYAPPSKHTTTLKAPFRKENSSWELITEEFQNNNSCTPRYLEILASHYTKYSKKERLQTNLISSLMFCEHLDQELSTTSYLNYSPSPDCRRLLERKMSTITRSAYKKVVDLELNEKAFFKNSPQDTAINNILPIASLLVPDISILSRVTIQERVDVVIDFLMSHLETHLLNLGINFEQFDPGTTLESEEWQNALESWSNKIIDKFIPFCETLNLTVKSIFSSRQEIESFLHSRSFPYFLSQSQLKGLQQLFEKIKAEEGTYKATLLYFKVILQEFCFSYSTQFLGLITPILNNLLSSPIQSLLSVSGMNITPSGKIFLEIEKTSQNEYKLSFFLTHQSKDYYEIKVKKSELTRDFLESFFKLQTQTYSLQHKPFSKQTLFELIHQHFPSRRLHTLSLKKELSNFKDYIHYTFNKISLSQSPFNKESFQLDLLTSYCLHNPHTLTQHGEVKTFLTKTTSAFTALLNDEMSSLSNISSEEEAFVLRQALQNQKSEFMLKVEELTNRFDNLKVSSPLSFVENSLNNLLVIAQKMHPFLLSIFGEDIREELDAFYNKLPKNFLSQNLPSSSPFFSDYVRFALGTSIIQLALVYLNNKSNTPETLLLSAFLGFLWTHSETILSKLPQEISDITSFLNTTIDCLFKEFLKFVCDFKTTTSYYHEQFNDLTTTMLGEHLSIFSSIPSQDDLLNFSIIIEKFKSDLINHPQSHLILFLLIGTVTSKILPQAISFEAVLTLSLLNTFALRHHTTILKWISPRSFDDYLNYKEFLLERFEEASFKPQFKNLLRSLTQTLSFIPDSPQLNPNEELFTPTQEIPSLKSLRNYVIFSNDNGPTKIRVRTPSSIFLGLRQLAIHQSLSTLSQGLLQNSPSISALLESTTHLFSRSQNGVNEELQPTQCLDFDFSNEGHISSQNPNHLILLILKYLESNDIENATTILFELKVLLITSGRIEELDQRVFLQFISLLPQTFHPIILEIITSLHQNNDHIISNPAFSDVSSFFVLQTIIKQSHSQSILKQNLHELAIQYLDIATIKLVRDIEDSSELVRGIEDPSLKISIEHLVKIVLYPLICDPEFLKEYCLIAEKRHLLPDHVIRFLKEKPLKISLPNWRYFILFLDTSPQIRAKIIREITHPLTELENQIRENPENFLREFSAELPHLNCEPHDFSTIQRQFFFYFKLLCSCPPQCDQALFSQSQKKFIKHLQKTTLVPKNLEEVVVSILFNLKASEKNYSLSVFFSNELKRELSLLDIGTNTSPNLQQMFSLTFDNHLLEVLLEVKKHSLSFSLIQESVFVSKKALNIILSDFILEEHVLEHTSQLAYRHLTGRELTTTTTSKIVFNQISSYSKWISNIGFQISTTAYNTVTGRLFQQIPSLQPSLKKRSTNLHLIDRYQDTLRSLSKSLIKLNSSRTLEITTNFKTFLKETSLKLTEDLHWNTTSLKLLLQYDNTPLMELIKQHLDTPKSLIPLILNCFSKKTSEKYSEKVLSELIIYLMKINFLKKLQTLDNRITTGTLSTHRELRIFIKSKSLFSVFTNEENEERFAFFKAILFSETILGTPLTKSVRNNLHETIFRKCSIRMPESAIESINWKQNILTQLIVTPMIILKPSQILTFIWDSELEETRQTRNFIIDVGSKACMQKHIIIDLPNEDKKAISKLMRIFYQAQEENCVLHFDQQTLERLSQIYPQDRLHELEFDQEALKLRSFMNQHLIVQFQEETEENQRLERFFHSTLSDAILEL